MAGNTRFHNKHHTEQHHSVQTSKNVDFPDAATDPLASPQAPYQGPFYINGLLNVDNQLPIDTQYDSFKHSLPAIQHNYFENAVMINDSLSATGDVLIQGNLTVQENLYVDKNVFLSAGDSGFINFGDTVGDKIIFNAYVNSDIIPTTNDAYNLGTANRRWSTIYGRNLNLDGSLTLGSANSCLFKTDINNDSVLIGTCSTDDANTKLHVKGGHTEIETTLRVTDTSVFDNHVTLNSDMHLRDADSIIFGLSGADNHITAASNKLQLNSATNIVHTAPAVSIEADMVDVSSQTTLFKHNELIFGAALDGCLIHLQSGLSRVGIGTCDPETAVHIDGGTKISGTTLNVTATTMNMVNTTTNTSSTNITSTATTDNKITGKNVTIQGTDSTGDRAVHIHGDVLRVEADARVDMVASELSLASQKTHVSLIKATDALKIDTKTVVVDSSNDRVGVNKTSPETTLHVGGDSKFDSDMSLLGDLDVSNKTTTFTSTTSISLDSPTVTIDGTDEIELNTPTIDINSEEIDLSTQSTTFKVIDSQTGSVKFVSDTTMTGTPVGSLGQLASVSTSTATDTILSIDGKNKRVGILTDDPDKTLTIQGDMSVTGDLTEMISTTVDVDSTNMSLQAGTKMVIDTPELQLLDSTQMKLKSGVDTLNIDNGTISVDSFNNRVGIGTTTPSSSLHVQGTVKTSGVSMDIDTTSDTTVDSKNIILTTTEATQILSGHLGLDVATPVTKLHVNYPQQSGQLTNFSGALTGGGIVITHEYSDDTYTPGVFWSTSNNNADKPKAGVFTVQDGQNGTSMLLGTSMQYSTGLTSYVKIDSMGKVGINTTDCTHDLTVNGSMKAITFDVTDVQVDDVEVTSLTPDRIIYKSSTTNLLETNDALYCNATTGQIGINTTTPASASSLHVHDGSIYITDNFKTMVLDSNFDLSHALINATNTIGTVVRGAVGNHVAVDLLNTDSNDSIAFRHSKNNSGIIDTVGMLYAPGVSGDGAVGIGVDQNTLGSYTLAVGGATNIKGDLLVEGDFLIQGSSAQLEIQNLEITDKNVVVNKGGTTNNSVNAGLIIFGGADAGDDEEVGYVKVDPSDTSLLLAKAPTGKILTLNIDNDVTLKMASGLNVTGTSKVDQDVSTTGDVTHNSLILTTNLINNIDINVARSDLDQVIIDRQATQDELDTTQTGAGLSATGDYVVNVNSNYMTLATSLNDADVRLDTALKNEETARINNVSDLQDELDTTQTGAGLATDGTYVTNTSASYISNATDLNDADVKLDAALRSIDNIVGHGLTPTTSTNHLTRLNNLDGEVIRLDGRIDDTNTDVAVVSASLDTRVDKQVAKNRLVSTDNTSKMTNTALSGWVSGTSNQIDVTDDGAGGIVLSLPQGDFVTDSAIDVGNITLTDETTHTYSRLTHLDANGMIKTTDLSDWISGTSNQITVTDDDDGTVTLSTPQDIDTGATPTFTNILLTGMPSHSSPASGDKEELVVLKDDGTLTSVDLGDKMYSGNGITVSKRGSSKSDTSYNSSVVIDHNDTSSQGSVTNSTVSTSISGADAATSNRQVIQDISLDGFGHVTSITSKDVSYGLVSKTSPGLVPMQVTDANSAGMFLNADNQWVTYPNVTEKVESLHPSLLVTPTASDDTIDLDISNTLTIGATTSGNSGLVEVLGYDDDDNYTALKLSRARPRIELTDTAPATDVTHSIINWGGDLRVGGDTSENGKSSVVISSGERGNVTINSDKISVPNGYIEGRSTGYAFSGDLEGNALTSTTFSTNKTITLAGDLSGTVDTDFSETTTITATVNKVQNDAVELGTNTSGQFLTDVIAGTNVSVTAHGGTDGDTQTISVIDSPVFTKVTAGTFDTTSDQSLKENINLIVDDPLAKINQLEGVSFNWKSDPKQMKYGLIANEVEQIIPEAVTTNDDGIRSIDYNAVVAHLIEAVKTLTHKVDQLSS